MEKKTAIEFKNVSKVYKLYKNDKQRFRAIFNRRIKPKLKKATDNVSFTIKEGESVALFGRNGAGKSTILKMITGVAYPSSGEITVNGRVSALLELTAGFDPEFTGRENIYFRGQLLGIDEKEVKAMEEEIIDFADLGDYIDQPVRTYSSGMKARLGFAINANIKPEILIVDEALSVGDKEFRQKCNRKINEIVDTGATFLFVTHSTGVARNFCKRGIVLKMGRIIFDGDIDDAIAFYEDFLQKAREARMSKESQKVLG
ncbi:MAG: ABC transporter ATP-binding protein [Emergencia sp.]|nr:ABC transporter ATP-binding protein [Emergencia sp.]